jgi:ABC-type phosphate transport system permease subunit
MNNTSLVGLDVVMKNLSSLPSVVNGNADLIMGRLAAEAENFAKANRPWTDRTGNARRSITGTHTLSSSNATMALAIGVDYGKYLELSHGGRFRIVWPTIIHFRPLFQQALKDLL